MIDFNRRKKRRTDEHDEMQRAQFSDEHPTHSRATWVAVAIGGSAVLGAGVSILNKPKDQKYTPLDISKVIADSRTNAAETLAQSKAMESQYFPGTSILRGTTDIALGNLANQNTAGFAARNSLLGGMGGPIADASVSSNPLLQASADRIMGQLNLGGRLDAETQAAATRAALQGAGSAGISGSGAARGLVARDLGLTSLSLGNMRTQNAQTAGNMMAQLGLQGENLRLQDYMNRYGAASGAAAQDLQSTGLLAQIIDNRAMPNAGLSATDIANLYSGQSNAQNQVNANNAAIAQQTKNQQLNALLGLGTTAAGLYAGGAFSGAGTPGIGSNTTAGIVPNAGQGPGNLGTAYNPTFNLGSFGSSPPPRR